MSLEPRVEALENRLASLEEKINSLLNHTQEVNASIANGFEKVEKNFEKVNEKIDALRGNSTSTIENVEIKLDDLKTEISKINEVTSYEEMFKNSGSLKAIKGGN